MATHTTYSPGIVYHPVLHNAIGVSTSPLTSTSIAQLVAGAKSVSFQLTGALITTRSTVFTVTVSMDGGTTYQAYSMLLSNTANANSETLTRVASITRNATGTDICWMSPETLGPITHIKAILTTTDTGTPAGTFTLKASICY